MARRARSAFDVPLNAEQLTSLGLWLTAEIDNAQAAKSATEADVEYWWAHYEQARTRAKRNLPWPDAADLTSYIPCEKVDAIHARIMRTAFVSPIWTVEGWGQAAARAPFVEEFHQWKAEEERFQSVWDKVTLNALVEPRALLEISEATDRRMTRKTIHAKPQQTPEGGIIFGEDGQPLLESGADGQYQEADNPDDLGVQVIVDTEDLVRRGPQYRVIPYRDSVILPGHARDEQEVWGYAKRFWIKKTELLRRVADGVYDADAVDALNAIDEREQTDALSRSGQAVTPADQATAQKELWEGLILVDLNAVLEGRNREPVKGKAFRGERWYVVTVHTKTGTILRWQHDDLDRSRFIVVIPFPRPDRVTEGYSFVGHKLITTTEEHTAYRNMAADRSAMAVNAPILKVQGALWDEDEQPWGPKQVVTVRDAREITPMAIPDVPVSVFQHIERCERTSERLAGVNDVASGQVSEQNRTLGEVQMATEQSFVRMDLVVRRLQESLEDVAQIRHAIWKRVLAEQPDGIDVPESVMVGLEGRGVSIDQYLPNGKMTAALLDGPFRFKPYGSVETADLNKMRNDLVGALQALPPLLQAFPMLAPMFQTPQAARAMGRHFLRVFRVPNPQAFLGSPSADMAQQQALDALPFPAFAPPPGMGMMPPGQPMPGMASGGPTMPSGGPTGPMPMPPMPPGIQ